MSMPWFQPTLTAVTGPKRVERYKCLLVFQPNSSVNLVHLGLLNSESNHSQIPVLEGTTRTSERVF